MKRLGWASDIHLNFLDDDHVLAFRDSIQAENLDGLMISGDISEADRVVSDLRLLEQGIDCPIWFVLGNHDFYRGGIDSTRMAVNAFARTSARCRWLPTSGVVPLSQDVALIGCDGWGDGGAGDYWRSPVVMTDFYIIREFADIASADDRDENEVRQARLDLMRRLGREEARLAHRLLEQAFEQFSQVWLLTHVPPFPQSTWHRGQPSHTDWLPFFCCQALGDVLLETMAQRPDRDLTIFCGHTHGAGYVEIQPNLRVNSAGAEYGLPKLDRVLELPSP